MSAWFLVFFMVEERNVCDGYISTWLLLQFVPNFMSMKLISYLGLNSFVNRWYYNILILFTIFILMNPTKLNYYVTNYSFPMLILWPGSWFYYLFSTKFSFNFPFVRLFGSPLSCEYIQHVCLNFLNHSPCSLWFSLTLTTFDTWTFFFCWQKSFKFIERKLQF